MKMLSEEQKAARAAYMRAWSAKNRDKVRAWNRRWAANNRDKVAAIAKQWAKDNPERKRELDRKSQSRDSYKVEHAEALRKWRAENPEKRAAQNARAYANNANEIKAQKREYYKVNPDKRRERDLRSKYGISLEQYDAMVQAQGGMCSICRIDDGDLVVDHCHNSGDTRGLLCRECNLMLGFAKDNVATLQGAIHYLRMV